MAPVHTVTVRHELSRTVPTPAADDETTPPGGGGGGGNPGLFNAAVVDWLSAPPDAALAGAIRAKLMALPYIPAECDGLPCTGIISLTT